MRDSLKDKLGEDPSRNTKGGREDDANLNNRERSATSNEERKRVETAHIPQSHLVRGRVLNDEDEMRRQRSEQAIVGQRKLSDEMAELLYAFVGVDEVCKGQGSKSAPG